MVEMAKDWELVKPQAWFFSPWQHVKKAIPEGKEGLSVHFEVTSDMLKEANLERVEHVTVTMNVEHTRRGDISVDLISPEGIISHIATDRKDDAEKAGYDNWTFMSVVHWGESGIGKWTLVVKDNNINQHQGQFVDWHLKLWGESIDADKATLLPMPKEDDDADHDEIISSTQTAPVSTATGPPRPEETNHDHSMPHPSEHPQRPTKPSKPEEKPKPTETEDEDESASETSEAQEAETSESSTSWISWLPTLGASKAAQPWIYAAIGIIAAFCIGLGIAFIVMRRKRQRNDTRSSYEFAMLDEEETEGLNPGEKTAAGNRRTRGGELYDAFAGGSEDEDDFDRYSDREPSVDKLPGDRGETGQFDIGGDSDSDDDRENKPLR